MYKLIALDMDGTLLKDDKTISKANFDAIQTAKAKGIKVILATGRPIKGIQKYLEELNLTNEGDYAVAFNGAVVQGTKHGNVIVEDLMSLDDLKYLYDISKKLQVNIHALTPEDVITPKVSKYSIREATMNNIPLKETDFSTLDRNTLIVKIMFIDEKEILDRVARNLPEEVYEKFTVVRSEPFFLEFLNKTANKGTGVHLLAKSLGIKQEEVICVGDAGNDIHMVEYAGLGVAMENAFPELKNVADYVTKSNEEDGVAHVINKFILKSAF